MILAAVLPDAANSEQPLGRKPLATEPKPTDPYKYAEPSKPWSEAMQSTLTAGAGAP